LAAWPAGPQGGGYSSAQLHRLQATPHSSRRRCPTNAERRQETAPHPKRPPSRPNKSGSSNCKCRTEQLLENRRAVPTRGQPKPATSSKLPRTPKLSLATAPQQDEP